MSNYSADADWRPIAAKAQRLLDQVLLDRELDQWKRDRAEQTKAELEQPAQESAK